CISCPHTHTHTHCEKGNVQLLTVCVCVCVGTGVCVSLLCEASGSDRPISDLCPLTSGTLLPVLLLLLLCGVVGLAAVGIWCCYKHKLHPLKSSAPSAQTIMRAEFMMSSL